MNSSCWRGTTIIFRFLKTYSDWQLSSLLYMIKRVQNKTNLQSGAVKVIINSLLHSIETFSTLFWIKKKYLLYFFMSQKLTLLYVQHSSWSGLHFSSNITYLCTFLTSKHNGNVGEWCCNDNKWPPITFQEQQNEFFFCRPVK